MDLLDFDHLVSEHHTDADENASNLLAQLVFGPVRTDGVTVLAACEEAITWLLADDTLKHLVRLKFAEQIGKVIGEEMIAGVDGAWVQTLELVRYSVTLAEKVTRVSRMQDALDRLAEMDAVEQEASDFVGGLQADLKASIELCPGGTCVFRFTAEGAPPFVVTPAESEPYRLLARLAPLLAEGGLI